MKGEMDLARSEASRRVIAKPLRGLLGAEVGQRFGELSLDELKRRTSLVACRIEVFNQSERSIPDDVRAELWHLNEEMTRRGIPPCLRGLPDPSDDDPDQIADRVAIDAQWLVARYPDHKTRARRWQYLWRPNNFHTQAEFISLHYPRRDLWWFVRALALSDTQDRELHFLRRSGTRKNFELVHRAREGIRVQLAAHYYKTAKHPRHRSSDPAGTISRRLAVWELGALFGWESPTVIARLYTATTGQPMGRNIAAKVIDQIARALPKVSNQIDKARGKST